MERQVFYAEKKIMLAEFAVLAYVARRLFFYSKREIDMRHSNRLKDEIREIEIIPNFNPYAEGSCLIKCGGTHVVCTASVEEIISRLVP